MQHFADDTDISNIHKWVKNLNKLVDGDIKQLNIWLNANKMSLNVEKTELVILKKRISKESTFWWNEHQPQWKEALSIKLRKIYWCKDWSILTPAWSSE